MLWPLLALLAGFVLLWKGGDWIVDGADRFARGRGMPSSLAGVFILGFATSAPELAVTLLASLKGDSGIALGNVVGSNIANTTLILGVAAALAAVAVDRFLRAVEMPYCILASIGILVLFQDGSFDRTDGLLALGAFALYSIIAVITASKRPQSPPHEGVHRPLQELALAAFGLACLVGGAELFVYGAKAVAEMLGAPQVVIGLTLVAIGTSLPELATTVAAARSNRMELAVGNIVGSNIFNILLVLGVASTVRTQVDETGRLQAFDLPVMLGVALLAWIFALFGGRLRRWQGWFLLLLYAAYLATVTIQTAQG